MKILKWILTIVKDITLLAVVGAIAAVGIYGVRLPYRSVFAGIGPYQLQAFPTGLAFFYAQRQQTPFYNLSPVNDYFYAGKTQVMLLDEQVYQSGQFTHQERLPKPGGIWEAAKEYFDAQEPWYTFSDRGLSARYASTVLGQTAVVTRTVTLAKPENVTSQTMTFWYNTGDVIFDTKTQQVLTPVSAEELSVINAKYGFHLLAADQAKVNIAPGDAVGIINPNYPGWLKVWGESGDTLAMNKENQLITLTGGVDKIIGEMTMRMYVGAYSLGEGSL